MTEQILSVLYGASGLAASALYFPQIVRYHRDQEARLSISLLSWAGWIAIAAVTILYALLVAGSQLIAAVAALNAVAQLIVLLYGVHARLTNRTEALPQATALVVETIVPPAGPAIKMGVIRPVRKLLE